MFTHIANLTSRLNDLIDFLWKLGFITALCTAVCLPLLQKPLDIDEPVAINRAVGTWEELIAASQYEYPSLYFLLLKLWIMITGDDEIMPRLLSLALFAGMVVVIGLIGRDLADKNTGIVGSLLVISSTRLALYYATTARPYALLGLLAALSLWLILHLSKRSQIAKQSESISSPFLDRFLMGGIIIVFMLGIMTHTIFLFLMGSLVLSALLVSHSLFSRLVICAALALTALAIIWWPLLSPSFSLPQTAWQGVPGPGSLKDAVSILFGGSKSFILFALLGFLILSRLESFIRILSLPFYRMMILTIIFTLLIPFIVSQTAIKPVFNPARLPILVFPIVCVLVSFLITQLYRRYVTEIGLSVFLLLSIIPSYQMLLNSPVNTARNSVAAILEQAQCGDILVTSGLSFAEVTYYTRALHAPNCLRIEAFPKDIELHPGWIDIQGLVEEITVTYNEARLTADRLLTNERPGTTIWFFRSYLPEQPITLLLQQEFDTKLRFVEEKYLAGNTFEAVRKYEVPRS